MSDAAVEQPVADAPETVTSAPESADDVVDGSPDGGDDGDGGGGGSSGNLDDDEGDALLEEDEEYFVQASDLPKPERMESKISKEGEEKKKDSLWKEILQASAKAQKFSDSHIIVLGRKDVGKSSVIRELQAVGAVYGTLEPMEEYPNVDAVAALDYAFLNVRNVDDEDPTQQLAKSNLFMVQHARCKDLLLERLKPEYLSTMAIVIVLDMSCPWTMRDDLAYWLEFAGELSCDLLKELPLEDADARMHKLAHYIIHYKNRVTAEKAEEYAKRHLDGDCDGDEGSGDLLMNIGLPVVVVCAKSDTARALDTRETVGHYAVAQAHLRNLCCPYGASLFYVSAKERKNTTNIDLLYRYLMHRIYDFEFKEPADMESREGYFLPSGWDTMKQIEEFAASTVAEGLSKPYESIIVKPIDASVFHAHDSTKTEDMQSFLSNALAENPSSAYSFRPIDKKDKDKDKDREKDKSKSRDDRKDRDRDRDRKDDKTDKNKDKTASGATQKEGEKPLRNFFENLLVKRQGEGGGQTTRRDDGDKDRDRDRDKERERKSHKDKERKDKDRDRDKDKDRERDRDRDKDRKDKDKDRDREKDKERKEKKEKRDDDDKKERKKEEKEEAPA